MKLTVVSQAQPLFAAGILLFTTPYQESSSMLTQTSTDIPATKHTFPEGVSDLTGYAAIKFDDDSAIISRKTGEAGALPDFFENFASNMKSAPADVARFLRESPAEFV